MLHWIDHLLFAALAVLGPLSAATFGYRRLTHATPERLPRVRRSVYRVVMAAQWGLTAILAADWLWTRRPWTALGLVPQWRWGAAGIGAGTLIVIVFIARQRAEALRSDEALEEVRDRLRHVEPLMPRTPAEMRTFAALAVTAGICEEVLYRGFMILYLSHFMTWPLAAALASLVFGVGHAYQGPRGVLLTAFVGGFMAAVYAVSGSIYPAILLHALMDLHSGHLGYRAFRRYDEREAERHRALVEDEVSSETSVPVASPAQEDLERGADSAGTLDRPDPERST